MLIILLLAIVVGIVIAHLFLLSDKFDIVGTVFGGIVRWIPYKRMWARRIYVDSML